MTTTSATDGAALLPTESALAAAWRDYEDLLTQGARAFLLGAGCSNCAGLPLMRDLTKRTLESVGPSMDTKEILAKLQDHFLDAEYANIEDFLSELVDFIAIAERRCSRGATLQTANLSGVDYTALQLRTAAAEIKSAIASLIDVSVKLDSHLKFVRAVHRPVRPGKLSGRRTVDYLILNYDTLIESALAIEKLSYSDGMNGGTSAWWDSTTFDAKGLDARILKLHGTIDWVEHADDPLPRRIAHRLNEVSSGGSSVMIWPASTKYRETQRDPYAQLIERAREALRPANHAQVVLTVCGYSFGDTHINYEIERALRESNGELTVAVFTFEDAPNGELLRLHRDQAITKQIRIYARRGFHHGPIVEKSENPLSWSEFERFVRLLSGEQ